MTRDAEMPASQYVGIVLRGIRAETDLTGVRALLGQATTRDQQLRGPGEPAPTCARSSRQTLAGLVAGAEPGSDHQLAFARAYSRRCLLRRRRGPAGRLAGRHATCRPGWWSTPTCAGR